MVMSSKSARRKLLGRTSKCDIPTSSTQYKSSTKLNMILNRFFIIMCQWKAHPSMDIIYTSLLSRRGNASKQAGKTLTSKVKYKRKFL